MYDRIHQSDAKKGKYMKYNKSHKQHMKKEKYNCGGSRKEIYEQFHKIL